jgi:hypothetical protein
MHTQRAGWVEHPGEAIAVVPAIMGIASAFALGAGADAVAPPMLRAACEKALNQAT